MNFYLHSSSRLIYHSRSNNGSQNGLKGDAVVGNNLFVGRQWKVINEKKKTRGLEWRKRKRAQ